MYQDLSKIAINKVSEHFKLLIKQALKTGSTSFKSSWVYEYSSGVVFNFFAMFGSKDTVSVSLLQEGTTQDKDIVTIGSKIAREVSEILTSWYRSEKEIQSL